MITVYDLNYQYIVKLYDSNKDYDYEILDIEGI